MTANIEFPQEVAASVPVASSATRKRLFLDNADGSFKTKDSAGAVAPLSSIAVVAWTHNAVVNVGASPYAAALYETVKVDADTGAIQVNLPTAVGATGQQIKVVSLSDAVTPPVITVAAAGGQFINGVSTRTLTTPRERLTVESDGSNWLVV